MQTVIVELVGLNEIFNFDERFLMSIATIGAIFLGEYTEACAVMFFYQAGELIGHKTEEKCRDSIKNMFDFAPDWARRITDSGFEIISPEELKINDCINELDDLSLNENFFKKTRMQIMGIEGKASIEYWNGVRNILPPEFDFDNRQRNADDLVNSMLNYGYAILESEVTKNILLSGLDPYCGFLHFDMPNRTSLTYDLMEEFRQQLVDKVVFTLINHNRFLWRIWIRNLPKTRCSKVALF